MSDESIAVLLVEDNPGDVGLIKHHLRDITTETLASPSVTHVESVSEACDRLEADEFDVVLLDLGLPESSGIETLTRLQERFDADLSPVAVVVLTGLDDDQVAVDAIQRGAQDYLVKGNIDGNVLERSIRYALERHRQEQRLKRQNERLDQFASVVSHDLRNPLSIAIGNVERVRAGDDEALDTVEDALHRMNELVDDLLAIAREGESVDDAVPVSVGAVATDCWENVDTAGMTLSVDADVTVLADESRLRQLFENLYRNAREHAGTEVAVEVGLLEDGFYVADDGPGIPESERDDVFDPGYTTHEAGTGFGLNIVREVARAHEWSVRLTESDTGGARFEFSDLQSI